MSRKTIFFDVHGHIQFPVFDNDRNEVIKRAREAGIKMIAVGTQASTSKMAIEVAHQFPEDVWATVGFHPNHAINKCNQGGACPVRSKPPLDGCSHFDLSQGATSNGVNWHRDKNEQSETEPENFDIKILRELAADSKVVAISECGFDFFYPLTQQLGAGVRDDSAKKAQEYVFSEQANLARELNKPLMMHCRPSKGTDNAYEYALEVLKDPSFNSLPKIMHFYAGSLEMAKKLANLGFYFTFGGVITFAKSYDEIIKYLPLDRIFAETDCPYVAPQSHRGKRNEPVYVVEVVQKLAELKGLDFEKTAEDLYGNLTKIFNLS
ncbi:MAG: TatD family hydrolase [Patescibacteria group bacterium]